MYELSPEITGWVRQYDDTQSRNWSELDEDRALILEEEEYDYLTHATQTL